MHLAHCLMRNHIHIVVRPGPDGISKLIQRLLCAYARWFNTRHAQVGHVFQDRFGSRPVTGDVDLLWLVRYVHRNPVEAGLVSRAELWPWSSHRDHLRPRPPGYLVGGARMLRDMLAEETGEADGGAGEEAGPRAVGRDVLVGDRADRKLLLVSAIAGGEHDRTPATAQVTHECHALPVR